MSFKSPPYFTIRKPGYVKSWSSTLFDFNELFGNAPSHGVYTKKNKKFLKLRQKVIFR